jgi:lysyl-tRNA synthetase class 2
MNDEQQRLRALHPALEIRSRVFHAVRSFFQAANYLEVDTPVRIPCPALELHIDAEPSGDHFLRTSPELHMKRLLAAGYERIYQIGPCYRVGECGPRHEPEFTMLEWYRAGTDYRGILEETHALLKFVSRQLGQDPAQFDAHEIISVDEAFQCYAGWSPVAAFDADRFDLDLVDKVEPQLPRDVPVVLMDYPAELGALAKLRGPVAERWELYLNGVEIANAYSELSDAAEQRTRFEHCAAERKALGKAAYPIDEAFMEALPHMPEAGGIAVGMDRLTMHFAQKNRLDEITAFPKK